MKRLVSLLFELFKISLFVVGGGYAIIVVADEVFAKKGWTEKGEIVTKLPVFQMVPGLIATHVAVYVGAKIAGRIGAALGVVAVAIPSVVIFTFVSAGYDALELDNVHLKAAFAGLRSGLTGIIASSIVSGWRKSLPDAFSYAVMAFAVLAISFFGFDVALVLACAMAMGIGKTMHGRKDAHGRRFPVSVLPLLLFLKYGALCFGGGFVLVPMYIESFVGPDAPYLQIADREFANLMALTQMTPGPIGVNGATFFGYRLAGIWGAIAASAMLLLPGSMLVYWVLKSIDRFSGLPLVRGILCGAKPASVALMVSALAVFAKQCLADGWVLSLAISAGAFVALWRRYLGAMAIIFASALFSCLVSWLCRL